MCSCGQDRAGRRAVNLVSLADALSELSCLPVWAGGALSNSGVGGRHAASEGRQRQGEKGAPPTHQRVIFKPLWKSKIPHVSYRILQ